MVVATLASTIGSTEGAIKLLLSLFIGYPLALLYRSPLIYNLPPSAKHILFTIVGCAICYYNFGTNSLHLLVNVTIIYLVLVGCGGTKFSVIFAFVFNTSYLVAAYYFHMSQEYGISWTMPHCVLTLRLTGVAFDFYDGQKNMKKNDNDMEESALSKRPGYLEMLGHTFFFGGVMVGPQFSLKRYLQFVQGEFSDSETKGPPDSGLASLKRLVTGLFYILLFQVIALYLPDQYLYSPAFDKLGIITKCALVLIWGKNAWHKYVGVWLVTEGSIILTGMSYNGLNSHGDKRWDACTNIRVWSLETGVSFADFIRSFNVNTNQWMSKYIYKRLRFLGSKILSQLLTLFYLALWHGLQSGYYMCFFMELIQTNAESKLIGTLKLIKARGYIPDQLDLLRPVGLVLRRLFLLFLWSYALVSFVLHDFEKWNTVYHSMYYVGHILPLLGLIFCPLVNAMVPTKSETNGVYPEKVKKEL